MKKRDFETYQKRFRDFEIVPKFSETHIFRGTIRHPLNCWHTKKDIKIHKNEWIICWGGGWKRGEGLGLEDENGLWLST